MLPVTFRTLPIFNKLIRHGFFIPNMQNGAVEIPRMGAGLHCFPVGFFCSDSNFSPVMAAAVGFICIDNYRKRLSAAGAGSF